MDSLREWAVAAQAMAHPYLNRFHMALTTDNTCLSTLPAAIFLLIAPFYLYRLTRRKAFVDMGGILAAKGAIMLIIGTFELSTGIVMASELELANEIPPYSPFLSFFADMVCIVVACIEYSYAVRPSLLISFYLVPSLVLDVNSAMVDIRRGNVEGTTAIVLPVIGFKVAMIMLEETPKLLGIHPQRGRRGEPVLPTSVRYRSRLQWLYATSLAILLGAKDLEDIPDIARDFDSQRLYSQFTTRWARKDTYFQNSLAKVCLKSLPWRYYLAALPRIVKAAFAVSQPFLVCRAIRTLGVTDEADGSTQAVIYMTILLYLGIAVSKATYLRMLNLGVVHIRGVLSAAIYNKTLNLSQVQLKKYEPVQLLTVDMCTIETLVAGLHDAWASCLELFVGGYILYSSTGAGLLWAIVPVWGAVWLLSRTQKPMKEGRARCREEAKKRVAATSNMLEQLTGIRTSGLALVVCNYLQSLQLLEMNVSMDDRIIRAGRRIIVSFCEDIVPPLVLMGAFIHSKATLLSVDEVFTIFAMLATMIKPMHIVIRARGSFQKGLEAFQKIQEFLLLDEFQMSRIAEEAETAKVPTADNGFCNAVLTDASVKFGDGKKVLESLNMRFLGGNIYMVVGFPGSGKSTLLKTILGEIPLVQGNAIVTAKSIAYCSQSPWLQNLSIHENIVGHGQCDTAWYNTVLSGCELHQDLRELDDGDETLAGFGGRNLTVPQRHRIALARAVYSRAPLVLLDEALESMDNATAEKVLDNLLGKTGLLRQSYTTVIMTTAISDDLSTADEVYFLEEDGKVKKIQNKLDENTDKRVLDCLKTRGDRQPLEDGVTYTTSDSEDEPTESLVRPIGSPQASVYFDAAGWLRVSIWSILVCGAGFAQRLSLIYARLFLEHMPGDMRVFGGAMASAVLCFALTALNMLFYYLIVVPAASATLHKQLVEVVLTATLWFSDEMDRRQLLQKFDGDLEQVSSALPDAFMDVAYLSILVPVDVIILGLCTKFMATLLPFMFLAIYSTIFLYFRGYFGGRTLDLKAKARLRSHLSDSVAGMQHIRAFNWQMRFKEQNFELLDISQRPHFFLLCNEQGMSLIMDLTIVAIGAILVSAALATPEGCSKASLGMGMVSLILMSTRLSTYTLFTTAIEEPLDAMTRIQNFSIETPFEVDKSASSFFAQRVDDSWSSFGRLEFRGVNAPYNPSDATSGLALSNVRLSIEIGQKILITGPPRSGKSSMLLAIQNFFEYTGTITVDGRDIRGIPRYVLRKNILTMSKDGVILDGTLRFNLEPYNMTKSIPPSRRLSDEYIIGVLRRMRLWQYIEARGGTLDSELSELRLGPEQKQLVSIARVILRKLQGPVCLLLNDCATDNLHPDTADAVESLIDDTFHSCTILTISSRPQAEQKAEIVIKMRAGRIAGTFTNGAPIDMDPYAFLKDLPWLSPSVRHRVRMAYGN